MIDDRWRPRVAASVVEVDELLEREDELAALAGVVDTAAGGSGTIVLVAGEAGSGKSSLVRTWLERERERANVHVGWCDDLSTARPFGPLHDVARRSEQVDAALRSGDRGSVFAALGDLLDDPLRPSVLVLEDVHWADDPTLDVVRHLARRIATTPSVLVLTYRDDELLPDHALVPVLGLVAAAPVARLHPGPLSAPAVVQLAGPRDVDVDGILSATGGNAFLVSEMLAHDGDDVPAGVRAAMLGRVAGFDEAARDLVDTLAVVPGSVELGLVERLDHGQEGLAVAERHGVLVVSDDRARFRHELLRRAIVDGLGGGELRRRHRQVVEALLDASGWSPGEAVEAVDDPVRIVHFAAAAGRVDVVVALGPHASSQAHEAGAHDIADRIQRAVLDHAHALSPHVRARLYHERTWTLYSLGRHLEAMETGDRAVTAWSDLDDPSGEVRALVAAARTAYMANDPVAGSARARQAIDRAEVSGDDELVAEAAVAAATHAALLGETDALALADDAVDRTRVVGREDLESLARNYRGVALLHGPGRSDEAVQELERAVELGRRSGDDEARSRAILNLLEAHAFTRDSRVDEWLARARDLDDGSRALDGFRANVELVDANVQLDRGEWDRAAHLLDVADQHGRAVGVIGVAWALARARLGVRRGERDAASLLDQAVAETTAAGAQQFAGWMLALRLEHAWLHDLDVDRAALTRELEAITSGPAWAGELAAAARRVGITGTVVPTVVDGPWVGTSPQPALLREAGLPYDEALALVDRGSEDDLRRAISLLDDLGAVPAATLARRHLAALGAGSVPRGPNRATRRNPAGLTPRQLQVLELLVDGCSNREIADELVVSVRTVEDHVSAVLARLDVASRDEAASVGAQLLQA